MTPHGCAVFEGLRVFGVGFKVNQTCWFSGNENWKRKTAPDLVSLSSFPTRTSGKQGLYKVAPQSKSKKGSPIEGRGAVETKRTPISANVTRIPKNEF